MMDVKTCREYVEHTWRKNTCRNCANTESSHPTSTCDKLKSRPAKKTQTTTKTQPTTKATTTANLNDNYTTKRPSESTKSNHNVTRISKTSVSNTVDDSDSSNGNVFSRINGYEDKTPNVNSLKREASATKLLNRDVDTSTPTNYSIKVISNTKIVRPPKKNLNEYLPDEFKIHSKSDDSISNGDCDNSSDRYDLKYDEKENVSVDDNYDDDCTSNNLEERSGIRKSFENLFDQITDDSLLTSFIEGFSMSTSEYQNKKSASQDIPDSTTDTMSSRRSDSSTASAKPFQVKVSNQQTNVASAYKVVDITGTTPESALPYDIVDVAGSIPESSAPGVPKTAAPTKTAKQLRSRVLSGNSQMSSFGGSESDSVVGDTLKDKGNDAELKAAIRLLDDMWKDEEDTVSPKKDIIGINSPVPSPKPKPREVSIPKVPISDSPLSPKVPTTQDVVHKPSETKTIYAEAALIQSSSSDSCDSRLFNKGKTGNRSSGSRSSTDVESSIDDLSKSPKNQSDPKAKKRSAPSVPPPQPPLPQPPKDSPSSIPRSNSITDELQCSGNASSMNFSPIPEPTFRFVRTGAMGGFKPRPPTPDAEIYSPKLEDIQPTPLPTEFDENYGTMGASACDLSKQSSDQNAGGIMSFFSKMLRRGKDPEEANVSTNDLKLMKSSTLSVDDDPKKVDNKSPKDFSPKSPKTTETKSDKTPPEKFDFNPDISPICTEDMMKSTIELLETKVSVGSPKNSPKLNKSDKTTLPKDTNPQIDKVIMRNKPLSPKITKKPTDTKGADFTRELEMRLSKNIDRSGLGHGTSSSSLPPKSGEFQPENTYDGIDELDPTARDDRPMSMPPNIAPVPPGSDDGEGFYLPPWESKVGLCENPTNSTARRSILGRINVNKKARPAAPPPTSGQAPVKRTRSVGLCENPTNSTARRSILGRISANKKARPAAPPPASGQAPVKRTRSVNDPKIDPAEISAPIPAENTSETIDRRNTIALYDDSSSSGVSSQNSTLSKGSLTGTGTTVPKSGWFPDNQYEPVLPTEATKASTLRPQTKCSEGYLEPVDAISSDKVGQAMTLDRPKGMQVVSNKPAVDTKDGYSTTGRQKVDKTERKSVEFEAKRDVVKKNLEKDLSKKDEVKVSTKDSMKKDKVKTEKGKKVPKVEDSSGKVEKSVKIKDKEKILQDEREKLLACQPIYEEIPGSYDDMYFINKKTSAKPDTPPKLPSMSPQLNIRSQTLPRNLANRSQSLTTTDRPTHTLRPKVKPDIPKTLPNRSGVMDRSFHESPIRGAATTSPKPVVASKRPISEAPKDELPPLPKAGDVKSPQESKPKPEIPQTVPNRPKPVPRKKPQTISRPLVEQYQPIAKPGSSFWSVPEEQIRESFQLIAESCFETLQHILKEYDNILFHNDPGLPRNELKWKDFDIIVDNNKLSIPGAFKAKMVKSAAVFHLMPIQPSLLDSLYKISHINWLRIIASFKDIIPPSYLSNGCLDSASGNVLVSVTNYTTFSSLSNHFMSVQELLQINSNKYCQQFIFTLIQIFSAVSYFLEHSISLPDIGLQDIAVASFEKIGGKFIVIWPKNKAENNDNNVCGVVKRVVQEMVLSYLSIDRKLPRRYEMTMDVVNEMLSSDSNDCIPIARSVLEMSVWGPSDERLKDLMNSDAPEQNLDLWLETERFHLMNRYAKLSVARDEVSTVLDLYRLKFLLKSSGAGLVQVCGLLMKPS